MNYDARIRHFPSTKPFIRPSDISLSIRVQNCLRRLESSHGIIDLSQLSRLTLGDLLKLKNFGRESLIDLLSSVLPLILDETTPAGRNDSSDHVTAVAERKNRQSLSHGEVENLLCHPENLRSFTVGLRHFPRTAPTARLSEISISMRAQKCLIRLKASRGIADLSQLSQLSIRELLEMKNFGRKSLVNLLSSVLPIILDDTSEDPSIDRPLSANVTEAAGRLSAQSYSLQIRCTDPRFKSEVGPLLFAANSSSSDSPLSAAASLHDVAHRLVGRTRDSLLPERILSTIRKIRLKVARARKIPLERELNEIVQTFVIGRNAEMIKSLLGWDGTGAKTLQVVGDKFHITREGVRQISSKITKKMRGHCFTPALKRAMTYINKLAPAEANDVEEELRNLGITRDLFLLDGVVEAAKLLGRSVPFLIEQHHGTRTVVHDEDIGLSKSIVRLASKAVSHGGLGKVGDLCDLLKEQRNSLMGPSVVSSVLQSVPSIRWLDDGKEWFYLADVPRNHLVTLVEKVLSVAPNIHANEMRAAISGDFRGLGFAPPRAVVLEFCRIACNCTIDGLTIIAKRPPLIGDVLSKIEQIAYSVLVNHGPLLHRADFERMCIDRGMNTSTFANYVGRLPFLARYGPAVYGLRGATLQPGDVERCIPPATKRLRDHGWTENAMPWLAVELSYASLSSGVIGIPSGVSRFIGGRYVLKTQVGSEVGNLVISKNSGWGLGSFFRKRGGEPGDVVVLTFDLQRHEAVVRVGTKEDVFTISRDA